MEIFLLRKLILILFIYSSTLPIKCESNDYCNNFTDCNKCTLCNDENKINCKCEWTNKGCIYNKNKKSVENEKWYSKIKICQNFDKSNDIENIYCPKSLSKKTEDNLDEDNRIQYTIKSDSNGNYGKEMTICNFEFEQDSHKDIILTVDYASLIFLKPEVYIESIDSSGIKTITIIDKYREIKFKKNSKVIIKVLLRQEYKISPITIKINLLINFYKLILSIIYLIIFIIILILIISIIFCYLQRREKKKKMHSENIPNSIIPIIRQNNNIFTNNRKENMNLKKLNKQKLNNLFKNKMNKRLYKNEYNQYGMLCTICLNKFDEKSEISITSCKHIFHHDCIHNWFYKNIKNPKCPNCKHEVLKDENNLGEKKETNIITIGRRNTINNFNNNSNQLGDGNRRAITLNINHRILNGDSSKRYQIQEN